MDKQSREYINEVTMTVALLLIGSFLSQVYTFSKEAPDYKEAAWFSIQLTGSMLYWETLIIFLMVAILYSVALRVPFNRLRRNTLEKMKARKKEIARERSWGHQLHFSLVETVSRLSILRIVRHALSLFGGVLMGDIIDHERTVGFVDFYRQLTTIGVSIDGPSWGGRAVLFAFAFVVLALIYAAQNLITTWINSAEIEKEADILLETSELSATT